MRRVWQQFSRLNPSVYSAALCGGCCVPPCVADVITVKIARYVCNKINEDYYYYYFRDVIHGRVFSTPKSEAKASPIRLAAVEYSA